MPEASPVSDEGSTLVNEAELERELEAGGRADEEDPGFTGGAIHPD